MKLRLVTVIGILAFAVLAAAAADTAKPIQSVAAFDRLMQMSGEWESKDSAGKKSHIRYEVVSGGSAVVERFVSDAMGADNAMETVYYLDGNRLLLTHYCMAHNQPRMQAESFDSSTGELKFAFLDATGLSSPNAGHMHSVSMRFVDSNHVNADWNFFQDGKLKTTESVQYTRVK
jgi:hypothetical protein